MADGEQLQSLPPEEEVNSLVSQGFDPQVAAATVERKNLRRQGFSDEEIQVLSGAKIGQANQQQLQQAEAAQQARRQQAQSQGMSIAPEAGDSLDTSAEATEDPSQLASDFRAQTVQNMAAARQLATQRGGTVSIDPGAPGVKVTQRQKTGLAADAPAEAKEQLEAAREAPIEAVQGQQEAVATQAEFEQAGAAAISGERRDLAEDLKKIDIQAVDERDRRLAELADQSARIEQFQETANREIDASKFMADRTAAQRVGLVVAGIFSALGDGMLASVGQKGNFTEQFINRLTSAIDQDIQVQQQQIENARALGADAQNLLSLGLREFETFEESVMATRAALIDRTAQQIQAIADRLGGAKAQEKAAIAIGELKKQEADLRANQLTEKFGVETVQETRKQRVGTFRTPDSVDEKLAGKLFDSFQKGDFEAMKATIKQSADKAKKDEEAEGRIILKGYTPLDPEMAPEVSQTVINKIQEQEASMVQLGMQVESTAQIAERLNPFEKLMAAKVLNRMDSGETPGNAFEFLQTGGFLITDDVRQFVQSSNQIRLIAQQVVKGNPSERENNITINAMGLATFNSMASMALGDPAKILRNGYKLARREMVEGRCRTYGVCPKQVPKTAKTRGELKR